MKEIAITIGVTLFCAWLVWMFKARQLYFVISRMFGHGALTSKGKLVKVRLYNRGNGMEELQLNFPTQGHYEIVGSEHPDLFIEKKFCCYVWLRKPKDLFAVSGNFNLIKTYARDSGRKFR